MNGIVWAYMHTHAYIVKVDACMCVHIYESMATRKSKVLESLAGQFDTAFFKALSEPARIELLKLLILRGPCDIESIAAHFPQDRSVISRHLGALRDVGIVRCRKEGRRLVCNVDGAAFVE